MPLGLEALRFLEKADGFGNLAPCVEGVCQDGGGGDPQEGVAAAIGVVHRLTGGGDGGGDVADDKLEFAEAAVASGGVVPVAQANVSFRACARGSTASARRPRARSANAAVLITHD